MSLCKISQIFTGLVIVLLTYQCISPGQKNRSPQKTYNLSGFAQGTTYHITYYAHDSLISRGQVDQIFVDIDSSLSIYKLYSLVSQFNSSPEGVEMDEHLRKVIVRSFEIFNETNGISDISVFPLVQAWGFGIRKVTHLPDSTEIQGILPCVGSEKIQIIQNRLVKNDPCVQIDVNGIAQGYSVDVLASFLEKKGILNYLIEVGGEMRINGRKPDNKMWQIGIESPAEKSFDNQIINEIIQVDNGGISTSGIYRKYSKQGDKTISHLINPKTGFPFKNELISVTVLAPDAISADGYDNALMGMGLKSALEFLNQHKELEAYFIYQNNEGLIRDTATVGFYKLMKSL